MQNAREQRWTMLKRKVKARNHISFALVSFSSCYVHFCFAQDPTDSAIYIFGLHLCERIWSVCAMQLLEHISQYTNIFTMVLACEEPSHSPFVHLTSNIIAYNCFVDALHSNGSQHTCCRCIHFGPSNSMATIPKRMCSSFSFRRFRSFNFFRLFLSFFG